MPPVQNNSYPLAIVLESKNSRAVSRIDETMLTNIVACAAIKLSYIQGRDDFLQRREEDFAGIDSNGLGELLSYYKTEFYNFKNSDDTDSLGILFLKCIPKNEESKVQDFERFLNVLKELKRAWNGRHLAMLGSGEFVFSIKGNISEDIFNTTANLITSNAENMLSKNPLPVKSHTIWLNRNKMKETEQALKQNYMTLFTVSVMNKFKEMSEAV
jgi:hypothetical protein